MHPMPTNNNKPMGIDEATVRYESEKYRMLLSAIGNIKSGENIYMTVKRAINDCELILGNFALNGVHDTVQRTRDMWIEIFNEMTEQETNNALNQEVE